MGYDELYKIRLVFLGYDIVRGRNRHGFTKK